MQRVWQIIIQCRNEINFRLRKLIRWQRGGFTFSNQPKENLFDYLQGREKELAEKNAQHLIKRYQLQSFYDNSTRINFRENLFYLSMLENGFDQAGVHLTSSIKAADIGPAHWFYVQAVYAGLTFYGTPGLPRQVDLTGFEVDAYRVYSNFYSRMDYARAHIRSLPVTFQARPFETQTEKYDLILMFFPFVFMKDHLSWGLPIKRFNPLRLRTDAKLSLTHNGFLFIVNQGLEEHLAEKKCLQEIGMTIMADFEQDDLLYRYDLKRFVLVAKK